MPYNPDIHHRRSVRLKNYDYRQAGAYFVTICTHQRAHLFGDIVDGAMVLNSSGKIAVEEWNQTAILRNTIELDAFVVMPNHLHGILVMTADAPLQSLPREFSKPLANSLASIVGTYKAAVTRRIRRQEAVIIWQRSFHDVIIRDEPMLNMLRDYVQTNPARWKEDKFYRE